jgi:hypothetical protein
MNTQLLTSEVTGTIVKLVNGFLSFQENPSLVKGCWGTSLHRCFPSRPPTTRHGRHGKKEREQETEQKQKHERNTPNPRTTAEAPPKTKSFPPQTLQQEAFLTRDGCCSIDSGVSGQRFHTPPSSGPSDSPIVSDHSTPAIVTVGISACKDCRHSLLSSLFSVLPLSRLLPRYDVGYEEALCVYCGDKVEMPASAWVLLSTREGPQLHNCTTTDGRRAT